jgi:Na+/melibiose symporter-like transporter
MGAYPFIDIDPGDHITSNYLTRKTKLIYGSGDINFYLTSTIIGAYFAIFLSDVVGLSAGLAEFRS